MSSDYQEGHYWRWSVTFDNYKCHPGLACGLLVAWPIMMHYGSQLITTGAHGYVVCVRNRLNVGCRRIMHECWIKCVLL